MTDQGEQPPFGLGAGELRFAVQRRLQCAAAPPWQLGRDLTSRRQSEDLGLFGGAVELVLGQVRCQIPQCPCWRGEGQAVVNGGIEGERPMDPQAWPGPRCGAGDGDVDGAVVAADTPQLRGAVVAQDAAVASAAAISSPCSAAIGPTW